MQVTSSEISSVSVAVAAAGVVIASASWITARRAAAQAAKSADAAQRSAGAAEEAVAIQGAQLLRETRPRLSGRVARLMGGSRQLIIALETDEPLASVDVWIPPDQGPCFITGAAGVRDPGEGEPVTFRAYAYDAVTGQPSGLQPRQQVAWPLKTPPARALPVLRIEADCTGAHGQRWPHVLIEAEVDSDHMRNVW